MHKLINVRRILETNHVDALLITSPYNKFYLAGLYSGSGYVFITQEAQYAIVDFRYYTQVKDAAKHFTVIEFSKSNPLEGILNRIIREQNIGKIGFEGDYLTFDAFMNLNDTLQAGLVAVSLKELRKIKDAAEIQLIQAAADIADQAYSHILKYIKCGMTERQVANELVRFIKECGGQKEAFDTIVASGGRGALPHGKASDKVIREGELVTIDFGVNFNNYCSDITRTFAMSHIKDQRLKEIYEIVKKAQAEALKRVKPGVTTGELDAAARDIIQDAGYGEYFGHNSGHGLGILVHEYPDLAPNSGIAMEKGMVITIEPGIYIPGLGGVRIEDDVLIIGHAGTALTKSSKELVIVKG